jgi:succinate dehydrogenase / fumarate reductase cytochrome b subunit
LGRFISSTLGKKAIMAVTGFVMFGFVVGHLVGNLQVFAGDGGVKLNAYAHFLKTTPALLWGTRIVVGVSLVLHVWAAATLKRLSNEARPVQYKMRKDLQASVPSRNMFWGGITLFFYVVYHLLHFTIGVASPIAATFSPENVYGNMIASFQNPAMAAVYVLAMGALGMHLYHGLYSLFQTLGLNHPGYMPRIRTGAKVFGAVVAAGFCSIPVAILAGLVK